MQKGVVGKGCYNCGEAVDELSPFCPSCGSAQIRVSAREPSPEILNQQSPVTGNHETLQYPMGYASAAMPGAPSNIQWKRYLKTAWPLALAAGIATGIFPPGGFLLFLPIAVIISLRLYRKHHFGPIRMGQGAILGAASSALSFLVVLVMFSIFYATNGDALRQMFTDSLNNALAQNPNPDAVRTMRSLIDSHEGMLALLSFMTFIFFCINTLFASLAGALAATLGQDKQKL